MPNPNQLSLSTPFGNGETAFIDVPEGTVVTLEQVLVGAIGQANTGQSRIRLTRNGDTKTVPLSEAKTTPVRGGDEISATPKTTKGAEGEEAPPPEGPASDTQGD